jgi:hypothetical protein
LLAVARHQFRLDLASDVVVEEEEAQPLLQRLAMLQKASPTQISKHIRSAMRRIMGPPG